MIKIIIFMSVVFSVLFFLYFITRNPKNNEVKNSSTTLINLFKIISIETQKIDPMKLEFVDEYYRYGRFKFESKNASIENKIPLKSLEYLDKDGFGYHRWTVSKNEYLNVYKKNNLASFIESSDLSKYLTYLDKNKHKDSCKLILYKYEYSSIVIVNTLEECIAINTHVTEDIYNKITKILKSLINDIKEVRNHEKKLERDMDKASLESFNELLDMEIEVLYKSRIQDATLMEQNK